jgi:hypothetical protein
MKQTQYKFLYTLLIFTIFSNFAFAQENNTKLIVNVSHSGIDTVGQQLSFSIKEAIRSSSGYKLGDTKESEFTIILHTIDPLATVSGAGNVTSGSAIFTIRNDLPYIKGNPQSWLPIYLDSSVIIAGKARIDEQAKSILASLDKMIEIYKSIPK